MNKLASILFLEDLGFCRTPIYIVTGQDTKKVIKDSYRGGQWVIRCGDRPDMNGQPEPYLPWAVADNSKDLISKIDEIQGKVPGRLVFIHRQRNNKIGRNLNRLPRHYHRRKYWRLQGNGRSC